MWDWGKERKRVGGSWKKTPNSSLASSSSSILNTKIKAVPLFKTSVLWPIINEIYLKLFNFCFGRLLCFANSTTMISLQDKEKIIIQMLKLQLESIYYICEIHSTVLYKILLNKQ